MSWEEAAAAVRDLVAQLPIPEGEKQALRDAVAELAKAAVRQMAADAVEIVRKTFYEAGC